MFPNATTLAAFAHAGMTVIRLPILWERLQPKLGGALDRGVLAGLDRTIAAAHGVGERVIIDVHDYGTYRGAPVGSAAVPDGAFAAFWAALARHVAALPAGGGVLFGLMNEPHDMASVPWARAEQAAIDAIRATGARNVILASGVNWDGAHNFTASDGFGPANAAALAALHDPAGRLWIEMHEYLDSDFSGTHADCMPPAQAAAAMAPATAWLRATHHIGFLGEFAGGRGQDCQAALDALLGVLDRNEDVWAGWTYWAAGAWWGDYMFSVQPRAGAEAPQMRVLRRHLGHAA